MQTKIITINNISRSLFTFIMFTIVLYNQKTRHDYIKTWKLIPCLQLKEVQGVWGGKIRAANELSFTWAIRISTRKKIVRNSIVTKWTEFEPIYKLGNLIESTSTLHELICIHLWIRILWAYSRTFLWVGSWVFISNVFANKLKSLIIASPTNTVKPR